MKKKEFSSEKFEEMYNKMMGAFDTDELLYPEMQAFNGWLDELQHNLMKTTAEAVRNTPVKEGFAEATMIAIGRFVCTFLEKMQRGGMVTEGTDIYKCFAEVLLPVCHKLVVGELDAKEEEEEKFNSLAEDVANPDLSIEEILNKHFAGHEDEFDEIRPKLEEVRKEAMKKK